MLFTSCSTVLLIFYCYHKNLRSKALIGAKPFIWDVWTAFAVLLVVNTIAQYCIFFLCKAEIAKNQSLFSTLHSLFSFNDKYVIDAKIGKKFKVEYESTIGIFHYLDNTFNWALTGENGKYSASYLNSPFHNFQ